MVKINPKTKTNLIYASLLLTIAGIAFALYTLSGIVTTVKKSRVGIAEINRDIALLNRITQDQRTYSDSIEKVKRTLPTQYYEVSYFVKQLERLAQDNGLTIDVALEPKKKEEKGTYNSIVYSMKLGGGYTSVSNFLTQMSKLAHHTSVDYIKTTVENDEPITEVKSRLYVEK